MRCGIVCLALAAIALPVCAQSIAGDWAGVLAAGGSRLRILVHIAGGPRAFSGTMDSLDQAAMGIPVSVAFERGRVKFELEWVHAVYQGRLNAARNLIHGTWMQGEPLPLDLARVQPSAVDGSWSGTLPLADSRLRFVLHLATGTQGLMASLQILDRPDSVMPAIVKLDGSALAFEAERLSARFTGTVDSDRSVITGSFTLAGRAAPMEWKRVLGSAELRPPRPQTPKPPYPYREEEVNYRNGQAKIRLSATLTVPQGKGPFPAALLITGSGPQDRDETIAAHKPFLVLADYLTRRGIAVLRADDRGVGKSEGRFTGATTADFAGDAEAGVAWLKTRAEIDARKIGLIGHSEGGIIAPMIAARNRDVAFVVMLAGTGVPGAEILVEQSRLIALADGASVLESETLAAEERQLTSLVKSEPDSQVLQRKLRDLLKDKPAAERDALIPQLVSPWTRFFLRYDPADALRRVSCPVLALTGQLDLQAPPELNLPAIRRALQEGGNRRFEVVEMPGLNHMFQTARTGSPKEYGLIEQTLAPAVLERIAAWIAAQ